MVETLSLHLYVAPPHKRSAHKWVMTVCVHDDVHRLMQSTPTADLPTESMIAVADEQQRRSPTSSRLMCACRWCPLKWSRPGASPVHDARRRGRHFPRPTAAGAARRLGVCNGGAQHCLPHPPLMMRGGGGKLPSRPSAEAPLLATRRPPVRRWRLPAVAAGGGRSGGALRTKTPVVMVG